MWNVKTLALLLATAAAASCHGSEAASPTPPGEGLELGPPGVYVLRTVNGVPLPAIANEAANLVVIADTLRLGPDGSGSQTGLEHVTDATLPGGEETRRYVRPFAYRLAGGRLEIEFPCPPEVLMLCAAPPHYVGAVSAGALELTAALYYRAPLRYVRVDR